MSKGKSRIRISRRDVVKGMARSRARVRDLRKKGYSRQAYDGSEGPGSILISISRCS